MRSRKLERGIVLVVAAAIALGAWLLAERRVAPGGAPAPAPAPAAGVAPDPSSPAVPPGAAAASAGAARPPEPSAPAAPRTAEDALTDSLRDTVDPDPARALELARDGEARFPDGPRAAERSFYKMRALVNLDRIGAARDEATAFFRAHPDSDWGERVWRLTGVQPRPRPPPNP